MRSNLLWPRERSRSKFPLYQTRSRKTPWQPLIYFLSKQNWVAPEPAPERRPFSSCFSHAHFLVKMHVVHYSEWIQNWHINGDRIAGGHWKEQENDSEKTAFFRLKA